MLIFMCKFKKNNSSPTLDNIIKKPCLYITKFCVNAKKFNTISKFRLKLLEIKIMSSVLYKNFAQDNIFSSHLLI